MIHFSYVINSDNYNSKILHLRFYFANDYLMRELCDYNNKTIIVLYIFSDADVFAGCESSAKVWWFMLKLLYKFFITFIIFH